MSRPNTRLSLKMSHKNHNNQVNPLQKPSLDLSASLLKTTQFFSTGQPINMENNSSQKEPQLHASFEELNIKIQMSKEAEPKYQSNNLSKTDYCDKPQQDIQKYLSFCDKQPQKLIYKEGPVLGSKNYRESLKEEDKAEEKQRHKIEEEKKEEKLSKLTQKVFYPPFQSPNQKGARLFYEQPQQQALEQPKEELQEQVYGKLLWFEPNKKNGRSIVFYPKKMTCQPIYKCFGCQIQFKVASALGGHLTRCKKKIQHQKNIAIIDQAMSKRTKTIRKRLPKIAQQKDEKQQKVKKYQPLQTQQVIKKQQKVKKYQQVEKNQKVCIIKEQIIQQSSRIYRPLGQSRSYQLRSRHKKKQNHMMFTPIDFLQINRRKSVRNNGKTKKIKKALEQQ